MSVLAYDLQVHTDASPCSPASPERMVRAAVRAGLDGIAITDHDTLANVERARAVAPDDFEVIPAVEVTTTQGHLLALYVEEAPPQADPLTVIDAVHDQGGLAVLSHPFDELRQIYDADLDEIARAVDAVEAVNSRCVRHTYNRRARSFASANDLPVTGGSDAHFPVEVGRASTVLPESPRAAIPAGTTEGVGRGRYFSGHVATKTYKAATAML